jgi:hypothetical protein
MINKKTIILMALIAFLISISPYVIMIIQIQASQISKASSLEIFCWTWGWVIPVCLSVTAILATKKLDNNKFNFKIILLSIISLLLSCLWAFLVLIVFPQLPPP